MERVVVALGGNALLRRGADDTFEEMYRAARAAAERIADIAADGWEVVVTHGNGPQVGRILHPAGGGREDGLPDAARRLRRREPGTDRLPAAGHDRRRLLRARDGAAGGHGAHADPGPTERPRLPQARRSSSAPSTRPPRRRKLEEQRGWVMKEDPHGGWRRVVPSPRPYSIVETPVVKRPGRRRRDRDRRRRRRRAGDREGPAADRQGGRRRQGPRRRDPRRRGGGRARS